ncbi:glycoside hydrolase family 105 protein [Annulohypoxylon maeteangense]|uniref:glycoside hydrolase family 105 protein n=1 Tax=Annulohypoxylon maeteangense TaxID=1927788 RepID=UPI002008471F|nr:glycoside hydrolase family 105 protein [Annulohypoxylon maeteangense]KAI0886037.1 glycoside hydrolase family 105 protein [Annulohypoxylon maeteangense]
MRVPTLSSLAEATVVSALFTNLAAAQVKYSTWMASSIMSRSQGIMTGKGGSSELLQAGITQRALSALALQYPSDNLTASVRDYIQRSAASVVPFTLNASYDALSYPLDRLSTGNALLALYSASDASTSTFRPAADALRQSIDLNRRNPEGGLWYFTYPQWSYLDGMYSLAPFYVLYAVDEVTTAGSSGGRDVNATAAFADMHFQLDLLWNHTRNATTGLLAHGYDASKTAVWADPITGASPHVWGRSLGWYTVALVETLETLPKSACKVREKVLDKFRLLAGAVIEAVDPVTGGWWQVLDEPGQKGNYIESSGSAMFSYALLKGARLGYLGGANVTLAAKAREVGVRGHGYLTETFLVKEANGTLGYNGTVAVCSLNSTATYEYYVGQPINYNSVLGSGAYVLASLEVEQLEIS